MSLGDLLDSFRGVRATVVGDLMLDEYVFGRASRISPEAPVMVVRQERTQRVPGGAANVAKNIVALGGDVTVIGVVGDDDAGKSLADAVDRQSRTKARIVTDPTRTTTRKTRIVADHAHQVLRIDHESEEPVSTAISAQLTNEIEAAMEQCKVVVLSDYLKGVLPEPLVTSVIATAKTRGVPVVANPKPKSCRYYKGATLVSLNRAETEELTGKKIEDPKVAAEQARNEVCSDAIVVTLGEHGLVSTDGTQTFTATPPKVEVYDTAGAGDTVIATLALACALGPLGQAGLQLAAETSARVVRHVGVAVPDERDLAEIRGL